MAWGGRERTETLHDLGTRLVEDGRAYAIAQVEVAKQTALAYVRAATTGIILLVVAVVLVLAVLPVLVAALGMVLAIWIGVPGGLAAGSAIVLVAAYVIARIGLGKLGAIGRQVA